MAPSATTRLGLLKPDGDDLYDVGIHNGNMDKLDNVGGVIYCTSSTRPTSPYLGLTIFETDTAAILTWNGTEWGRISGGVIGGKRYATAATLATTTGTTEALAGMATGTVPCEGSRNYKITTLVTWDATVIGDQPTFRVRSTNLAGQEWGKYTPEGGVKTANAKVQAAFTCLINTGGSGPQPLEFVLTVVRNAGTGIIHTYGEATSWPHMIVELMGHSSVLIAG